MRALAIVNPRAGRGSAAARLAMIRPLLASQFDLHEVLLDRRFAWRDVLVRAVCGGVQRVIAVGGDGTISAVVNAVLDARVTVALAAVGLGSSNDFHKPIRRRVQGFSVMLDTPRHRDVGRARWVDDRGRSHSRWFVVSASIGLVARANRAFGSRSGPFVDRLSRTFVEVGMMSAAAAALARHEDVSARIDGARREVANLSVMLTPFIAGGFRHARAALPGDGSFVVHATAGSSRVGLLATMARLRLGASTPGTTSWRASSAAVELAREEDLELDGEVFRARKVTFELVPAALEVCS